MLKNSKRIICQIIKLFKIWSILVYKFLKKYKNDYTTKKNLIRYFPLKLSDIICIY